MHVENPHSQAARSPLDEIYDGLLKSPNYSQNNPARSYPVPLTRPLQSQPAPSHVPAHESILQRVSVAASDSLLGVGHFCSRLAESVLPRLIATPMQSIGAGLGRAAGGTISAIGAAARIISAFKEDLAADSRTFSSTRRETVSSLGAIGAGVIVAEAGFWVTGAAVAAGAPAAGVAALGIGAAAAAGWAASYVRGAIGRHFDSQAGG
jgi:hypothetical protein